MQLETILSHSDTFYLGEETDIHLHTASLLVITESKKDPSLIDRTYHILQAITEFQTVNYYAYEPLSKLELKNIYGKYCRHNLNCTIPRIWA